MDDPGVLEVQARTRARPKIAVEHALPVQLEDSTGRKAAEQGLAHTPGIRTRLSRQDECFAHGLDGGSHDELVGGLGDLAGTAVADVDDPGTHGREHRSGPFQGVGRAAHHDRQAGRDGPGLAA